MRLIEAAELCSQDPGDGRNRELGYLLEKYQKDHAANFIASHDAAMRSHHLQERYVAIKASPVWIEFQTLARGGLIGLEHLEKVNAISNRLDELDCSLATEASVSNIGACVCSFRIETAGEWESMPERLLHAMENALSNFRTVLTKKRETVIEHLSRLGKTGDADNAQIAELLSAKLKAGGEMSSFGMIEVQVLAGALNSTAPHEKPKTATLPPKVKNEDASTVADEDILVQI
jgi:hypothetical protein